MMTGIFTLAVNLSCLFYHILKITKDLTDLNYLREGFIQDKVLIKIGVSYEIKYIHEVMVSNKVNNDLFHNTWYT